MGWDDAERVPSFQSLGTTFREQTREQRWPFPVLEEGVRHAMLQGGYSGDRGVSGPGASLTGPELPIFLGLHLHGGHSTLP